VVHIGNSGMLGTADQAARRLRQFEEQHRISILNVAGSRASKASGIHGRVMAVLDGALFG
jgi:hypothetical protein